MSHDLVLALAKELVQIDTVNPPGNELHAVRFLAPLLEKAGFTVVEHPYGPGRSSLVAHKGRTDTPSVLLSGHLDTVPFGAQPWSFPPLGASLAAGKLYGRGAADMKGGVAVLVAAAIHCAPKIEEKPLTLVLAADEEIGCAGAARMVEDGVLPKARCILVAEPTGNVVCLGHKGVLWLKLLFHGKTAHAAFPEHGDNALLKAARAALILDQDIADSAAHPVMGSMTLVTSRMQSGDNYNSVPDLAELGVDIRSTVNLANRKIVAEVNRHLSPLQPEIEVLFDLPAIWTDPDVPVVQDVFDVCNRVKGCIHTPRIVTFYTDGGVLGPGLHDAPVIILGPGQSSMAHQVDEYVKVSELHEGVELYQEIVSRLCA